MDPLEKATAILSAASGADAAAVAEQLKSDTDPQAIADALFEPKFKAEYDRGNNNAVGKTRREVERHLREAGAEVASFEKLGESLASLKTKPSDASANQLTGEVALKHPDVVAKINELKAGTQQEIDKAVEQVRKDLSGREAALLNQNVRAYYESVVDGLTPNYTPGREAVQRKLLVDQLVAAGVHRIGQDGKPELVDEHGELLTGDRGKLVTPADRARELADQLIGLPAISPRESPGVKPTDTKDTPTKHFTGDKPKNPTEYAALLGNSDLSAEAKQELRDWRAAEKPF